MVARRGLERARDLGEGQRLGAVDVAQLAGELGRLADVDHADVAAVEGDPLGGDLGDAADADLDRGPAARRDGLGGGHGEAAADVAGEGDVDVLGIREGELMHDLDEARFAVAAAEARIEPALLVDSGDSAAFVVVGRIDEGRAGEGEQLAVDGAVELVRVALLEVGAPAAADEEGVAGERHGAVAEHEADAARGVAGGLEDGEPVGAEVELVAVLDEDVGAANAGALGDDRGGADALAQRAEGGDVIGVQVGIEGIAHVELELLDQGEVALDLGEHRIDDDGVTRRVVGEQVRVRRGLGVEQLAKQHHYSMAYRSTGVAAARDVRAWQLDGSRPDVRPRRCNSRGRRIIRHIGLCGAKDG